MLAVIEGAIEGIAFSRDEAGWAATLDCEHARIEERRLVATSVLSGQGEVCPGIEQVFRIERKRTQKKSGKESREVVYGVTSLSCERASAREVLKLVRGH